MSDSGEEKVFQPTEHKLRKAREKGQVANSADFVGAVVTIVALLYIAFTWRKVIVIFNRLLDASVAQAGTTLGARPQLLSTFYSVLYDILGYIAPLLIFTTLALLTAAIIQHKGIPFSLHPITPDFNRINPGQLFKKVFSARNATEFAIALLRISVWFIVGGIILWLALGGIIQGAACPSGCGIGPASRVISLLMIAAAVLLLVIGLADLPLQSALFKREQRMGHQELRRELKETLGNPEIRSYQRGEGRRMMEPKEPEAVPTIVIYGPMGAVALLYDPKSAPVPLVLEIHKQQTLNEALRRARRLGVPVFQDNDLASDISRTITVGKAIRERHFTPVALLLVQARSM